MSIVSKRTGLPEHNWRNRVSWRLIHWLVAATDRRGQKAEEWSTDTATCAAQCGKPIVLGELHYAIARLPERNYADGESESIEYDGDDLAYLHLDCWPDSPLVIHAKLGGPDWAGVRSAPAS